MCWATQRLGFIIFFQVLNNLTDDGVSWGCVRRIFVRSLWVGYCLHDFSFCLFPWIQAPLVSSNRKCFYKSHWFGFLLNGFKSETPVVSTHLNPNKFFTSILFLYRYSLCLFLVWFSVVKRIKYKKDSIT